MCNPFELSLALVAKSHVPAVHWRRTDAPAREAGEAGWRCAPTSVGKSNTEYPEASWWCRCWRGRTYHSRTDWLPFARLPAVPAFRKLQKDPRSTRGRDTKCSSCKDP